LKSASLQYANALADVALAQGAASPVLQQLGDFNAAYLSSPELRSILANPSVSKAEKRGVAEEISRRLGASKIVRNFLFVVIDHQRTQLLPEIFRSLQDVVRERQGVAEANISSPAELSDAQKKQLAETLQRLTGKNVEARFTLDAKLLGGVMVRVGDTIYDGSLRNRLDRLRDRLTAE
jgi:F-type H+-transporting ATPase subunit delta